MKVYELRKAFLEYFKSKGHEIVQSSSLLPQNDPTILFTNAGMNQFKDLFLGSETRSYSRATTAQKCLRISGKHNDLENVGVTARHHTFFEMLGNFSFGDYFKEDAIAFAWDFSTNILKLDKSKIWITIFETDDESADLWVKIANIPRNRILRMGEKDNFWAMGDTGPCGPCSEMHFYIGDDPDNQSEEEFRKDDGSYLEFWNLVFMQYNRDKSGKLTPLPKPCVDTGMGLERIAAIVKGYRANYDIDIFRELIAVTEKLSGFKYNGSSYLERDLKKDLDYARDVAMRVISDHARASSFLVADGVTPGNDGRGYVLRRLIRRAVRHGRVLGFKEPFLSKVAEKVITLMSDQYPELKEREDLIVRLIQGEEAKFSETLEAGLLVLEETRSQLNPGQLFPGEKAFLLHDTYGFPLDLTEDALKGYGIKVDTKKFDSEMSAQKERSRKDRTDRDITFTSIKIDAPKTNFIGYQELESSAKLLQVIHNDDNKNIVSLIFDNTPFYGESGGQVGDSGEINLKDLKLRVLDTQKLQNDYIVHHCEVKSGDLKSLSIGAQAELKVDKIRRERIRVHHSATHIVHAALRDILGKHIKQAGSRVDDHSLRFDFSHFEPITNSQFSEIQDYINSQVTANHEVITKVMSISEAQKTGAVALFGEKYGESVRVVQIGPQSLEFCGGTHVNRSGDIGYIMIKQECSISAGVRRIECLAGMSAHKQIVTDYSERTRISELLKGDDSGLSEKIEKQLNRIKSLERELKEAQSKIATSKSGSLIEQARTSPKGIKVIVDKVDGIDARGLRVMIDDLRNRLGSGVVALGGLVDGNPVLVAGVTSDLTSKINAGDLIKEASKISGGRGGGKPDFAQAGGGDPSRINDALERLFELVE